MLRPSEQGMESLDLQHDQLKLETTIRRQEIPAPVHMVQIKLRRGDQQVITVDMNNWIVEELRTWSDYDFENPTKVMYNEAPMPTQMKRRGKPEEATR